MASHVEIKEDLLPLLGKKENVLDGITGFVEYYDFSKANSSYEARVQAITKVASICYQSPKSLGSVSLFDRLAAESAGLPSSSYEFVPVLLRINAEPDVDQVTAIFNVACGDAVHEYEDLNTVKYGEKITLEDGTLYLLTNLRALIEDVGPEESLNYLNTSYEEIQIIRDNFKVFLFNVDVPTRTQMIRHRINWQELSRRYVDEKKQPFAFYTSEPMSRVVSKLFFKNNDGVLTPSTESDYDFVQYVKSEDIYDITLGHYDAARLTKVKPERARAILPQAMLTTIWGAFQTKQLESYFKLRLDAHAQKEIRCVAEAMKELLDG